jgi:hypothetical protein
MAVQTKHTTRSSAGHAIMIVTGVIVGFLLLSILLVLGGANHGNMLVNFVLDVGAWLAHPFENLFIRRSYQQEMFINWGIAAIVYLAIGSFLARIARR